MVSVSQRLVGFPCMVGTLPVVLDGGRFTISRRCLMNQDALKNVSTCFNLAVAFLARNLLLFFLVTLQVQS